MLPFVRMIKYGNIAPEAPKIKKVLCGLDNLYVLYGDGSLYGCGVNTYLQLNVENTATRNTWILISEGVTDAWAGAYNILYLKGEEFIMHGVTTQLGTGNTMIPLGGLNVTSSFPHISNIKMISIGADTMHYVDASGSIVYGRGMNGNYSLGGGYSTAQSTFVSVINTGANTVLDILGTQNNTLILTSNNELLGCGSSGYGSLGVSPGQYTTLVSRLTSVKLFGGNSTGTLAYSASNIYNAGWQYIGQLGNGITTNTQVYPFAFNSTTIDSKIHKISKSSATSYVNMYATTEGKIYSTGEFGRNGSGGGLSRFTNTLTLDNYNPEKSSLYTCAHFSIVFDGNNQIYACGSFLYVPGPITTNSWSAITMPK